MEEAVICPQCGCSTGYQAPQPKKHNNGLRIAAKTLMIISTVWLGIFIIPLIWCLPMTIAYSAKIKTNEEVGVGFKICTLLFVNVIAGILMLCDELS